MNTRRHRPSPYRVEITVVSLVLALASLIAIAMGLST